MSRKKKNQRRRRKAYRFHGQQPDQGQTANPVEAPAMATRIRVIKYSRQELVEREVAQVDQIRGWMDEESVVWIDVEGLGNASVLQELGRLFGLHRLAMEDVVHVHQRPKMEEYHDHLFIVVRMVHRQDEVLETEQLSIFLGKNFVLTFQERSGDCLDPVRERIRQSRGRMRESKADYLAYALIDAVIDAYFPIVDQYSDRMDELDEQVIASPSTALMTELHDVRCDLMLLRRAIRPLRDALVLLMPDPHAIIAAETQFYFRDCYDHTVQLIDLLDNYREACSDLRDFYLSTVSNRMNEIMKFLTIMSTIFIPLGFIAGVYGMNFNTNLPGNMPELNWQYGYVLILAFMALVACGLLWTFWRKGWLGSNSK